MLFLDLLDQLNSRSEGEDFENVEVELHLAINIDQHSNLARMVFQVVTRNDSLNMDILYDDALVRLHLLLGILSEETTQKIIFFGMNEFF